MADGRRAKQARRDARRRKARRREPAADATALEEAAQDTPLLEEVRDALDAHPVDLLIMVSTLMLATSAELFRLTYRRPDGTPDLVDLVPAFVGVDVPETTALLAVLGELLPEEDALRAVCRDEVRSRTDDPPEWLSGLARATVHRAVRMSHVLGDFEELVIGVRLADGQEMTASVYVDHLMSSSVRDAFFVPLSVDEAVAVGTAANTDPDVTFTELDVADAGAELRHALGSPLTDIPYPASETWPSCYALVQWLARRFPAGGARVADVQRDWDREIDVTERFFTSLLGRAFGDAEHRSLLEDCADGGTGDRLRWSANRVRQVLTEEPTVDQFGFAEDAHLDLAAMLRAFIPFVHAESGIRQSLTDDALAAVDELADHHRALVIEAVVKAESDEDDE